MNEKPNEESQEADAEFERVLRNLVNTPHKPHVKTPVTESAKEKEGGGG